MKLNGFVFFFALVFAAGQSLATSQAADRLVYKGDTLLLFSNPLENYLETKPQRTLNGIELTWTSTACYRGYLATWKISNDSLFLISVQAGCDSQNPKYFDLRQEFGSDTVFAGWYSGNALAPQGKLLFYIHDAYESIYTTESEFQIDKGIVTGITHYDNSKARQSAYSQNDEKLRMFIYSNIEWDKLPSLGNEDIRVYVQFSADENGVIDSAKVMRGSSEVFDNEAVRVVKSIPDWDVYFRHGTFTRITWNLPIIFSEKNKLKYRK